MPSLFVTGAGTEVGKTYVSSILLHQFYKHGLPMSPFKPVISGYDPLQASTSDIGLLLSAAGLPVDAAHIEAHCPWRLQAPLAPPNAAKREGKTLLWDDLLAACERFIGSQSHPVLLEGAGGIMSPLTETHTQLDLAKHLGWPVVFVTGSYLGAISHALSGLHVLHQAGVHVVLTIISESAASALPLPETAEAIQRHTPFSTPIHRLYRQPLDRACQNSEDMTQHLL